MGTPKNNREVAVRFGVVAKKFCSIVDSASNIDRTEFGAQVYRILPKLIDEATEMPDVEQDENGAVLHLIQMWLKDQQRGSPLEVRHHEWVPFYNRAERKTRGLGPPSASVRSD